MKTEKRFTLLLFVTILVSVLLVLFRFVLPTPYPVTLIYNYPIVTPLTVTSEQRESTPDFSGETLSESASEKTEAKEETNPPQEQMLVQFPLELNRATFEQLKLIPRVGDVTASRIIAYRETLGGYTDISQLQDIKGIGPVSYETISAYVYISGDDWSQANS